MTAEERMAKLEMELRRMRMAWMAVSGLAAIGIGLVVVMHCSRKETLPTVVRARAFEVVDENDRTRASLSVGKYSSALSLADAYGRQVVQLDAGIHEPELVFRDKHRTPRSTLSMSRLSLHDESCKKGFLLCVGTDETGLHMTDENGRPAVGLSVGKDAASLSLYNKNADPSALWGIGDGPTALLAARKEGATLTLREKKDKPRVSLYALTNESALTLTDTAEKSRASLVAQKDGQWLSIGGMSDKPRVCLAALKDETWLHLVHTDEKTRASLDLYKKGPALRMTNEKGWEVSLP